MNFIASDLVIFGSIFLMVIAILIPAKYIKITRYIPVVISFVMLLVFLLTSQEFFATEFLYMVFPKEIKTLAIMFSLVTFAGSIFALQRFSKIELCFVVFYYLATLVVISTQSLFVLIVSWEAMAISGAILILANKTEESFKAGLKYTAMHLLSGCCMLIGIAGLTIYGVDTVEQLGSLNYITIFILASILINLAIVPFSSWLIDGYSSASYSASVFLCAFTTKASVLVLVKFFLGLEPLIYFGITISVFGAVMACFIKDARKMLGYGIMAQVGIMVSLTGYGAGVAAILLAFSHILYKALMFMIIGALMHAKNLTSANLNNLSFNYKHNKPITFALIIASLTSLAFPFTATVPVKALIGSTLHHEGANIYYYFVVLVTALTVFNIGFKLPYFVFFNNKTSTEHIKIKKHMQVAIYVFIFASLALTVLPFKMLGLAISKEELKILSYGYIFNYYIKQLMYILPAVLLFFFTKRFFTPQSFANFSSAFVYKTLYLLYTKLENAIISIKAKTLTFAVQNIYKTINTVSEFSFNLRVTNTKKTTTNTMLHALLIVFVIIITSLIISNL